MTDNIHIHRLRVALEKEWSPSTPIFVMPDDLKHLLDRFDRMILAIEDFEPVRLDDAEWRDEALNG